MATPAGVVSELLERDFTAIQNAATKFSTNPSIWLAIAKIIYRKITSRPVFTEEDYEKYNLMCAFYKTCTQPLSGPDRVVIPAEWSLDASHRPLYYSTFSDQKSALLHELDRVEGSSHVLKSQIRGIVCTIAELYTSIDKRWHMPTRRIYRPDGFEAMFYTELAMWAVIDLPRYPITCEKTAAMVLRRIEYCESIEKRVLIYRGDETIENPLNLFPVVIKQLRLLHTNLCQAHRAATFTDKVSHIDKQLLDMVSHAFNLLYSMMDESSLEEFNVVEFLDPSEGRAAEMSVLKETRLGQSIAATCEVAQIEGNDFQNHRAIPESEISTHLSDRSLPPASDIARLGFPQWVWRKDYSIGSDVLRRWYPDAETFLATDAMALMGRIRGVHCSILELCNVREMLTHSSQLDIAYGNKWLFSSEKGKLILESLITVVIDAIGKFQTKVNAAWKDFYTDRYLPFAEKNHKDSSDKEYSRMTSANDRIKAIARNIAAIMTSIDDIHSYDARHAGGASRENEVRQKLLCKMLHGYLSRIPGYDPGALSALRTIAETPVGTESRAGAGAVTRGAAEAVARPPLTAIQQRARDNALQELILLTDREPREIRTEWIDACAPLHLLALSEDMVLTPEQEAEVRANATAALVTAVAFFETSTTGVHTMQGDTAVARAHTAVAERDRIIAAHGERLSMMESMLGGRMSAVGEAPVVVRIATSGSTGFFSPTAGTAAAAGAGVGMGVELPAARAGAGAR